MRKQPDVNYFMSRAVSEALAGMHANAGGPFGAVIVHRNSVVAAGHNEVIATHDPTAHAEITAIRKASSVLERFDLSDCEIYSSCEPCPMCFSAIFWARIGKLYFASSRLDAERIGFDDKVLYDVLAGKSKSSQLEIVMLNDPEFGLPFDEWLKKTDRILY